MATLRAELGCERYLASTVVTGLGQRGSTFRAKLRCNSVFVLALRAFHCRPRSKKRARFTERVMSSSRCFARAANGHAAAAPPSAASNSRRPMVTVIRPSRARCVKGTIPRHERAVLTARHLARAGGTPGTAEAPASLCLGAVKRCVGARFSLRVAGGTAAVCGRGASAPTTSVVQFARNRLIGILQKSPPECPARVTGPALAYLALFDSI